MAAITASQCFRLKLLHILETAGQEVLTYTLLCGTTAKPPTDNLEVYLKSLPRGSNPNYTKEKNPSKCFNKTDMAQITADPTCSTFDITLLHKAIKLACDNVAGVNDQPNKWNSASSVPQWELEHFVTKIKDTRNEVVHEHNPLDEAAFLNRVADLNCLFVSSLEATKDRYGRDDAEYLAKRDEVLNTVTNIRAENLGEEEILQRSARRMLPLLKTETDRELRARLDSARYIDPLSFLSGFQDQKVEVDNIFCDTILGQEKRTGITVKINEIPHLEVLQLCEDPSVPSSAGAEPQGQARPHVLVVEGEAGSGKTTLATFMLSQWLKPQCDRHVQGLQHYDLLLWLVCRDQSSASLSEFIKVLLPDSYIIYGHLLLPLLKQCRVLVLVDGLDERNDASRQLVTDLLSEAATTTFSIVCTSRPESVQDMKTRAQPNFQVSHVTMLGITHTERTELVLRHYAWLTQGANTTIDTATLRRIMQHIGSRELFRLPLNLLFLAAMFFFDPDKVSIAITQSELYQFVHMWCEQKLQDRLAAQSQAGRAKVFRQDAVATVLSVMYEVALKGLLQHRVYLSNEDLRSVLDACATEGLEPEDVLPAFYCLRREVHFGVVRESYCAPHKGLQDFFAAKHIVEQLSQHKMGEIEDVLQAFTAGQKLRYKELRNMLTLLLGLLGRHSSISPHALYDTVDLLRQSGVRNEYQWLFLLAETGAPDPAVQRMVLGLGIFPEDEIIHIMDEMVSAISVVMPHLPPRNVRVFLTQEPDDVDRLAQSLTHQLLRHLELTHHFRHPHQHAASAHLLRNVPRDDLWGFIGHLDHDHLHLLPRYVRHLHLVLRSSDHARSFLAAIVRTIPSYPDLFTLVLHIPVAAVTPSAVTRLPTATSTSLSLMLSGVTDQLAETAWKIVAVINPPKTGFSVVKFPEATLDLRGWKDLFKELQRAAVTVTNGIAVPDTHITEDEENQLSALTTTGLGCKVFRRAEKDMWP